MHLWYGSKVGEGREGGALTYSWSPKNSSVCLAALASERSASVSESPVR